jgi:membrane protease subunit HflK
MNQTDKRGEAVAWMGLGLTLLTVLGLGLLAIWSDARSVWSVALLALGGLGIWGLSLIQLHQKRLLAEERLELAELERGRREMLGGAQTIFDEEAVDQMEKLAMGRRLRSIEQFLTPTGALLTALYWIAAGIAVLPWIRPLPFLAELDNAPMLHETTVLFVAGAVAFVFFMVSRYALGMSRLAAWTLLRAGGNAAFGVSAASLATALAVLFVISGLAWVEAWIAWGIGFLMIVLGAENIINFIFDFYRPRTRGVAQRAFYESRILGMFSEPGGILRSMANAVDYQFGFKVSETWFYRLLGRIILPLTILEVIVLFALTCVTVVPPGHKAVIEHLGRSTRVAPAGIHLTWCWPIDRATLIPVELVRKREIGFERSDDPSRPDLTEGPILWTKKHYKKEYLLLVADRGAARAAAAPEGADESTKNDAVRHAPPVNVLSMNMPVQWRVGDSDEDVLRFHAQSRDAETILEALAYRELTRYAAQTDMAELLGEAGIAAAERIHERLQAACDHAGYDGKSLGILIVHVGIGGVHPPADDEVAKAYEDVVSAIEKKDGTITQALGEASDNRIRSAGLVWNTLYRAILAEDAARKSGTHDLADRTKTVERLLCTATGGAARDKTATVSRDTLRRVYHAMGEAERFAAQVSAFEAAPEIYTMRTYLKLLADFLVSVRKFVIVVEQSGKILYDLNLAPPQPLDILGAEARAIDEKMTQP